MTENPSRHILFVFADETRIDKSRDQAIDKIRDPSVLTVALQSAAFLLQQAMNKLHLLKHSLIRFYEIKALFNFSSLLTEGTNRVSDDDRDVLTVVQEVCPGLRVTVRLGEE